MSTKVLELLKARRNELEAIAGSYANWSQIEEWHTKTRPIISKHFHDGLTAFDKIIKVSWMITVGITRPSCL